MKQYTLEERKFLLESYHARGKNITLALRCWSSRFKNRPKPSRQTVMDLIEKFERTGSLANEERAPSVLRTSRTPDNVGKLRDVIINAPTTSVRKASQSIQISEASTWRMMRKDLKMFPYKIQIKQSLSDVAIKRRLDFANKMLIKIDEENFDISKIIFSDEAHFWLGGYVNKQNYRIWGTEQPNSIVTRPLHPQKLTIWCGLCAEGLVGPYVFNETIDGQDYQRMITERLIPDLEDRGWIDGYYFQQDGAPAHTARETIDLLASRFGNRLISQKCPGGIEWPPYSPDLSPLDFYLWGYIKDRTYRNNPKTLEEVARNIEAAIENVTTENLIAVVQNFELRLRHLIAMDGQHIETILK